jgi:hypothetical protein
MEDFQWMVVQNCVWFTPETRQKLRRHTSEIWFREWNHAGSKVFEPSTITEKLEFDLNLKGPATHAYIYCISERDLQGGNWTKFCSDQGKQYIKEAAIIHSTTATEDSVPFSILCSTKWMEAFGTTPDLDVGLQYWDHEHVEPQWTGMKSFTPYDKVTLGVVMPPHKERLIVFVETQVFNTVFVARTITGKLYVGNNK